MVAHPATAIRQVVCKGYISQNGTAINIAHPTTKTKVSNIPGEGYIYQGGIAARGVIHPASPVNSRVADKGYIN